MISDNLNTGYSKQLRLRRRKIVQLEDGHPLRQLGILVHSAAKAYYIIDLTKVIMMRLGYVHNVIHVNSYEGCKVHYLLQCFHFHRKFRM